MLISLNRLFLFDDQTYGNQVDGDCKTNNKSGWTSWRPIMDRAPRDFLQIKCQIMQRATGNRVTTKSAAISRSHHVG